MQVTSGRYQVSRLRLHTRFGVSLMKSDHAGTLGLRNPVFSRKKYIYRKITTKPPERTRLSFQEGSDVPALLWDGLFSLAE